MTGALPHIAHSDIPVEMVVEFRRAISVLEIGQGFERPAREFSSDYDAVEIAIMRRLPDLKRALPKEICDACPDDRTIVLAVLKTIEENRRLGL